VLKETRIYKREREREAEMERIVTEKGCNGTERR